METFLGIWKLVSAFVPIAGTSALGFVLAALFLGLALWFPRTARFTLPVAIICAVAVLIYNKGVWDMSSACDAKFKEAERRFHAMEQRIAGLTKKHAAELEQAVQQKDDESQQRIKEYEDALAKLASKSDVCVLTDDDLRFLRKF